MNIKNLIACIVVLTLGGAITVSASSTRGNSIISNVAKLSATADSEDGTKDMYTDWIYPVGSIYMSVNDVNPEVLFGGKWEKIKDTFLLTSGDTYALGSTGGEATHTLTVNEMPSHKHNSIQNPNGAWTDGQGMGVSSSYYAVGFRGGDSATKVVLTSATGGSAAHNNMPPYLTVNAWKRTE